MCFVLVDCVVCKFVLGGWVEVDVGGGFLLLLCVFMVID